MAKNEDKRGVLEKGQFDYFVTKDKKVIISWNNMQVKILKGKSSEDFIKKSEGKSDYEKQLMLAKITGNFKRGNEKDAKKRG